MPSGRSSCGAGRREGRHVAHGLVVAAVHVERLNAQHALAHGARDEAHVVRQKVRDTVVAGLRHLRRDVLPQGPAQRYIEHLHAAAHAEERHSSLHHFVDEQHLEGIALSIHLAQHGVALFAKVGWVYIHAAREEHAVHLVERRLNQLWVVSGR